ncbi:GntR family transcriptional regulator [Rossellomorea sp. BNER]|jgi:GntR family transcriptional regulator|uniref:GntR family transcriptional regulator n=1 Tax=Rossellomorea sp. BNER TaxID=2962031 RepID=UPI003AF2F61D|nr:GntR family transcriptional regulator [Rossellomorea sp. BNER]
MKDAHEGKALHSHIKEEIIQLIKNGEYKPNMQLPTEAEFCSKFNVSRTTIRTALQQLTLEGYVYRKQGRGTFIAENKVSQTLTSTIDNYNEQLKTQGKKPKIKVLSLDVIPAESTIEKALHLKTGDPVNKLERIRYSDDVPLQYEIAYLPWFKTPGLNKEECEKSLYKFLETQFNLKIKRTVETIELFIADETISEKIRVKVGTPCFKIETTAYLEDGTIIEFSKAIFRGDKASFLVERTY